jgi:glycerol-3-phosphate dehydrogenase
LLRAVHAGNDNVSGLSPRDRALEEIATRQFDLLVIGGGIVGAGVAALAARHGLAVALVDRGDFAGATSSASSKLIHGGLRYLRLGDVGLVRESHAERRLLTRVVAPHLVRPLPFLLPLYEGGPQRAAVVQTGLGLYTLLARERYRGSVRPADAAGLVPDLSLAGLRACGRYVDAQTDDSRLTLANVRAAADAAATVVNYAEVVELVQVNGCTAGATVVAGGEPVTVRARAVVNAAGPWIDGIRRLEDPGAGTSVRLSKGVHAVVEPERRWSAALVVPQVGSRVSFAVPWRGLLLLGTTDTPFDGDPAGAEVGDADVEQVLAEAAVAVMPGAIAPERVRATYAGLRVLPVGPRGTADARRETVLSRGPGGMLTVAGGKLTTYRRIAISALEALRPELGLRRVDRAAWPLPGAAGLDAVRLPVELPPELRAHLLGTYGSLTPDVLAPAVADPGLLEPLAAGAPEVGAQVLYAARAEWAVSVEDVLRRRTTLALRGRVTPELEERVSLLLSLVSAAA